MPAIPSLDDLHRRFQYDPENGAIYHRIIRVRPCGQRADTRLVTARNGKSYGRLVQVAEGQLLQAARVAWALHEGEWPANSVRHLNGDSTDNRITNLVQRCTSLRRREAQAQEDREQAIMSARLRALGYHA
ncbi:MAG: HNH endonuclease [Janthinobacterium lividum]